MMAQQRYYAAISKLTTRGDGIVQLFRREKKSPNGQPNSMCRGVMGILSNCKCGPPVPLSLFIFAILVFSENRSFISQHRSCIVL